MVLSCSQISLCQPPDRFSAWRIFIGELASHPHTHSCNHNGDWLSSLSPTSNKKETVGVSTVGQQKQAYVPDCSIALAVVSQSVSGRRRMNKTLSSKLCQWECLQCQPASQPSGQSETWSNRSFLPKGRKGEQLRHQFTNWLSPKQDWTKTSLHTFCCCLLSNWKSI